jgi:hypothetical protein
MNVICFLIFEDSTRSVIFKWNSLFSLNELGCFSISALIPKGAFDVNHQKQFWSLLQSSFGLWV